MASDSMCDNLQTEVFDRFLCSRESEIQRSKQTFKTITNFAIYHYPAVQETPVNLKRQTKK